MADKWCEHITGTESGAYAWTELDILSSAHNDILVNPFGNISISNKYICSENYPCFTDLVCHDFGNKKIWDTSLLRLSPH